MIQSTATLNARQRAARRLAQLDQELAGIDLSIAAWQERRRELIEQGHLEQAEWFRLDEAKNWDARDRLLAAMERIT